jgi:hypothetical protein
MKTELTKINPNDVLKEYGLFAYHEYLVTGELPNEEDTNESRSSRQSIQGKDRCTTID